jgi:diguanylate cyclase (GGDEF)-like protein/PAS domain S-box-containing protein
MTNGAEGKDPPPVSSAQVPDSPTFCEGSTNKPAPIATDIEALRERAEVRWQAIVKKSPVAFDSPLAADPKSMRHDLQVHQIELELQNEELRLAKDALEASHARYIDLYDLAPVGYCTVTSDKDIVVQANLTLASLLGVPRNALVNRPFSSHVMREDQDSWYLLRKQCLGSEETKSCELRIHDVQQTPFWALLSVRAVVGNDGTHNLHISLRDVSAFRLTRDKLVASEERYRTLAQDMPLYVVATLPDGTLTYLNDAFAGLVGVHAHDLVGRNYFEALSAQDKARAEALLASLTPEHPVATHEQRWTATDGQERTHEWTVRGFFDDARKLLRLQAVGQDITAVKAYQSQLEHIAHFDTLTNLPNRLLLADRLQQSMAQAQRRGQKLAVAYLDLDGFKTVNDRYGHAVGDQLLVKLANAMKGTLREGDTLARLGGDEFVAVLIDLDIPDSCVPMLTRLLDAASEPVHLSGQMLQVSASVGVTFYPQALDVEADQLLRQADQAMYQAKLAGNNRYHVFDAVQDSSIRGHHGSLERIRLALAQQEFVLHYQPKVNMRSGKVIGAEALIRWQHPQKGLLPPAAFLPEIEDHPLAVELGEWVIETALAQIQMWRAAGLDLSVSVNVGARQLQQGDFVKRLQSILAKHPQVSPTSLELEVLETSALSDIAQMVKVIEDCASIGVRFALDDFGTGYSSLTYLKRLRVAFIKIDQSFVCDMLDDPDDLAILQGVMGLAAAFKCKVIAEGVETVAHGTLLLQLGCDKGQGYGIARPMPPEQMPEWAATWKPDPAWSALASVEKAPRSLAALHERRG